MKYNVVVLGGGDSPEREVSLRSARSVANAAHKAGFQVNEIDPQNGLDHLDQIAKEVVVLPMLHGAGGEDGAIQLELENRGLKYLGADSEVSKLCFDKDLTRQLFAENGIPIAKGITVTRAAYETDPLSKKPHILKVARGGSSIGTLIVRDPNNVDPNKIDEIFRLDDLAILEELVQGVEITVPILGSAALPVIEIQPPTNGEFDYENKYNGLTQELCPPVHVSEETQAVAQRLAEQVHRITGCRHLSRVDIIIRPDESMVVLEINTLPGMTNQSLFPKSAAVAGMDFPALVTKFVELVKGA